MPDSKQLESLCSQAEIAFLRDEPLAGHCTFRIGGPADYFLLPKNTAQLRQAAQFCRESGMRSYFLGNGSNVLFRDEGFRGAVIDLSSMEEALRTDGCILTASAGCSLMRLCRFAQKNSLTGLEFAYGIPGTLGGAIYMNAGAYGGEIADVLLDAEVLLPDGTLHTAGAGNLQLSYRHSAIQEKGICVVSARLRLETGDAAHIAGVMEDFMSRRREKQPLDKPSAGSTFKRPEGAYAAALIEQCGLKGYRVGGAAISEKHSGFVVNLGGARCADVLQLCADVAAIVKEKTGYTLEKEIRVVE
ncbi:MAG: UDP-N-acetylmuramate dehydrogenase [Faecalibacterium sp.]|jgi:UDP-N-acetylmuramate dehydrogenase|nr:UDP-N-acetylmuramate dehydrogenase [Faecalibacterium sp.]